MYIKESLPNNNKKITVCLTKLETRPIIIMLFKTFLHLTVLMVTTTFISMLLTKSLVVLILYSEVYTFLILPIVVTVGVMKGTPTTMVVLLIIIIISATELILTATATKNFTK